jgi:hypothetical protein
MTVTKTMKQDEILIVTLFISLYDICDQKIIEELEAIVIL